MTLLMNRTATKTLPVWVFGAGGLLAGELLRILLQHPDLRLAGAVTRDGGQRLSDLHPQLAASGATTSVSAGIDELERSLVTSELDGPAVVFFCLPHGQSSEVWAAMRERLGERAKDLIVVDLSADYRLSDRKLYEQWYGPHPDPEGLDSFVYGLPESAGDKLEGATRIAAPGCFATALQLATLPAARTGFLDWSLPWVFTGITGSSGSGIKPSATTHHPHRHGNLWAYALGGHRHEAELTAALTPGGSPAQIVFVPHSGPFVRGIHLTAHLPLAKDTTAEVARETFAAFYGDRPFVQVLDEGQPDLRTVVGSNRAALGITARGSSLIVTCAIDNVLKGGSGQAIQALNVALGQSETAGLPLHALGAI